MSGNVTGRTDELGRTTTMAYGARGQVVSITGPDPDGEGVQSAPVTTFGYDAALNRTSVTDPLERTTSFGFDAQNRIVAQTGPDPDGEGELEAPVTSYQFNLAGWLTSLTDPVGNVTSYGHDNAGRVVSVIDPLENETLYGHDAANQVISIVDRNGRERAFEYNALGQVTSETWLDDESEPIREITWTYDDAGRLIAAADPDSAYAFTYDLAGRLIEVDNDGTPNVPNVVLDFGLDYSGNRLYVSDNLGGMISYGYIDHRLAEMYWSGGSATAKVAFDYDDIGRLETIVRSDGISTANRIETALDYDDGDRLVGITHTSIVASTPTQLSQFLYGYDAANQIVTYEGPDGELEYEYDLTGQLIEVSGDRTESYSFDVNGNRTMEDYETGDGNRLLSDGVYEYEYDTQGNMISRLRLSDNELTEYTRDHRNRLVHIVVKDAEEDILKEAWYVFDVFDRRIGVIEDADGEGEEEPVERWTVYDGDNPYADFDEQGSLTTRYLYTQAIDQLFARMANGEVDWYLGDNLGSVRQIAKLGGTVLDNIDYDSFGQILSESDPENGDRFKYTSREWDALFASYYYRARQYGADIGRFYSEDPLGFDAGDGNLYRYVANQPTGATDPTGLYENVSGARRVLLGVFTLGASELERATRPRKRRWTGRYNMGEPLPAEPKPPGCAGGDGGGAGDIQEGPAMRAVGAGPGAGPDADMQRFNRGFTAFTNYGAGWGDNLSFGLTGVFRQSLGYGDAVNRNSTSYLAGELTGVFHSLFIGGALGLPGRAPGWGLWGRELFPRTWN